MARSLIERSFTKIKTHNYWEIWNIEIKGYFAVFSENSGFHKIYELKNLWTFYGKNFGSLYVFLEFFANFDSVDFCVIRINFCPRMGKEFSCFQV